MIKSFAILSLVACQGTPHPPPGGSASASGSAPLPAEPVVTATFKGHMRDHFGAVSELQRAIARGHLDDAKRHARWILAHDDDALAAWKPRVDQMRVAARAVAEATELPSAAVHAAALGRACGACHQEHAATIAFEWSEPVEDAPTLASQMKRHQWAAARLWEGLVGPSDEMWTQGATTLATLRLDAFPAVGSGANPTVQTLAGTVRELATRATTESDFDVRAKLYGELLSTCASCHAIVRPTPVPDP